MTMQDETRSANRPETRLATRLAFVAAGFGMAAWAPLVPYAKARVGVGPAELGLLLLCLGIGSVLAMPVTGILSTRLGSRPLIIASGIVLGLCLPALALAPTPVTLGLALLIFGAALGMLDVAMNAHAVEVEAEADQPLMSGFHGLFSLGGFAGAGGVTLLLALGAQPLAASLVAALVPLVAIALATPRLLRRKVEEETAMFALPRGLVLLLALLALATFLTEGAMLDWSALFITQRGLVEPALGGIGYMLFNAAMTVGRLTGDRVVAHFGRYRVLVIGALTAMAGLVLLILAPHHLVAMAGFLLIGIGAANIVPILFSAAGTQTSMPPALAVASITTLGYAGILAGPAVIGFIAGATSLVTAFWMLVVLMAIVPLAAGRVTAAR